MNSNISAAKLALQNAIHAFNNGDKLNARHWAQKAVEQAPQLEEPWLVLAAISEPHASQAYFEYVLKINPANQSARQGLIWAQKRLPASAKPDDTGALQPPDANIKKTKKIPSHSPKLPPVILWTGTTFIIMATTLILLLTISLFIEIVFFGNVPGVKAAAIYDSHQVGMPASVALNLPAMATQLPTFHPETATPTAILPSKTPEVPTLTPTPPPTAAIILPTPLPTFTPGPKRIEVIISQQRLYAYQGDQLVYQFVVSTGSNNNTPMGTFKILDKIPNPYSYSLGFYMPDWMGFAWVGDLEDGIHALPVLSNGAELWGNGLGTPDTTGCVVLSAQDAQTLYNWTDENMPLIIRY